MRPKKRKETMLLPDGRETTSDRRYVSEWRKFAKPICQATGSSLFGFDPGITIIDDKGHLLSLSKWFVTKINTIMEG